MSWNGVERRLHPRVPFRAEARLTLGDADLGRFAVRDISVGGALLVGNGALYAGLHVQVTLDAPQFGSVRFEADVVRVQSQGGHQLAGIAFRHPPSHIARMIEEVVLNELSALERAGVAG